MSRGSEMSSGEPTWLHGGMPLEAAVQAPAADVFSFAQWAPVSPYGNWSFWTGDFDGDGRVDVLAYDSKSHGLLVGLNKWPERRFDFENSKHWYDVSPYGDWTFWTGDFDGDGRADVLAYDSKSHGLLVGLNKWPERRLDFENSKHWYDVSPYGDWTFWTGDFDGDGRADVLAYDSKSHGLLVGLNKWPERRFDFENSKHWATVSEDGSWTFTPGHFAGDGRTDIVGYHTSGVLWVGRNMDGNFYFGDKPLGSKPNMIMVPGLFTASGRTDVVGYNPSD